MQQKSKSGAESLKESSSSANQSASLILGFLKASSKNTQEYFLMNSQYCSTFTFLLLNTEFKFKCKMFTFFFKKNINNFFGNSPLEIVASKNNNNNNY